MSVELVKKINDSLRDYMDAGFEYLGVLSEKEEPTKLEKDFIELQLQMGMSLIIGGSMQGMMVQMGQGGFKHMMLTSLELCKQLGDEKKAGRELTATEEKLVKATTTFGLTSAVMMAKIAGGLDMKKLQEEIAASQEPKVKVENRIKDFLKDDSDGRHI